MHAAVEECAARTAGQMHVVLIGSISAICPPRQGKVMVIVSIFLLGDAATQEWLFAPLLDGFLSTLQIHAASSPFSLFKRLQSCLSAYLLLMPCFSSLLYQKSSKERPPVHKIGSFRMAVAGCGP
jgi:hypothetical protein